MTDWLNFGTVKDYVLFALAIYAAVLSTWNLRQSLVKDRRRLQITVGSAVPTFGSALGDAWANVQAINIGQRPVTVTLLTFELPSGARLFRMSEGFPGMPDTPLPAVLSDGQIAQRLIAYRDIGKALVRSGATGKTKITPVCTDSSGKTYRGEPWKVDPQECCECDGLDSIPTSSAMGGDPTRQVAKSATARHVVASCV
jgi:hypothetical protein